LLLFLDALLGRISGYLYKVKGSLSCITLGSVAFFFSIRITVFERGFHDSGMLGFKKDILA
jgi:hypothetical protein